MIVRRSDRAPEVEIPDVLQKHGPRNDLADIANKILKQLELSWQQLDFSVPPAGDPRQQIDLQIANAEDRRIVSLTTVALRRPSASTRASISENANGFTK